MLMYDWYVAGAHKQRGGYYPSCRKNVKRK